MSAIRCRARRVTFRLFPKRAASSDCSGNSPYIRLLRLMTLAENESRLVGTRSQRKWNYPRSVATWDYSQRHEDAFASLFTAKQVPPLSDDHAGNR